MIEQSVESCLPRKDKMSVLFTFTIYSNFCFGFLYFFTLTRVSQSGALHCSVVGREEAQKEVEVGGKSSLNG